jgi:uncharacterized protein YkwD
VTCNEQVVVGGFASPTRFDSSTSGVHVMRTILSLAVVFGLVVAAPAADPPKITGTMPSLVLAQAASKYGKVTLTVKFHETFWKDVVETYQVEELRTVDGKQVKVTVPKTVTKKVSLVVWKETEVHLGQPGVSVSDATGKVITPDDVLKRLEKETAILRAVGGPADPFYLQTTKPDTLVLVTPPPLPPPQPATPVPSGKITPAIPPAPGSVPPPAKPKGELEPSATEKEIIDLANAERKKVGAAPLTATPLLIKTAWQHSANMARQSKLDHTLDGKGVAERLNDVGYVWSRCGENIAWGQSSPKEAIESWMNSPGHRENLLSTDNTQIGVAVATGSDGQQYWTMVLARPR